MNGPALTRKRAVVVGASVTGSLVARALHDHFEEVVLIDKDTFSTEPKPRRTVPQEHHVHLLLQRGKQIMERFYPGFLSELEQCGAEVVDLSHSVKWFQAGVWKNRWPTGIEAHYCTRTLVEHVLRRRALALPRVRLVAGTVVDEVLKVEGEFAVKGVRATTADGNGLDILADLVIDASGRGSAASKWLTRMGLPEVEREQIISRLGYASRLYRRRPETAHQWKVLLLSPRLPEDRRIAVVSPIEGNRWMVTTGGWFGVFPQADEASFLDFLKSMPVPDAYEAIVGAEPLSEVRRFTMSGGLRRRFDCMPDWPRGLFVVGDAVGSFNPIYSQGMSVCAMQVEALAGELDRWIAGDTVGLSVQKTIVKAIEPSWAQAAASDLRFPEIAPPETLSGRLRSAYFDALTLASARNREVLVAMLRVVNLIADSDSLYRSRIVYGVLKDGWLTTAARM